MHQENYNSLMAPLTGSCQADPYYKAACYLLSYEEDLCNMAQPYIGVQDGKGIDFNSIAANVPKHFGNASPEEKIVDLAYNLFTAGRHPSHVTLQEVSELPCPWPELITNSMFIAKEQAQIVSSANGWTVDYSRYQQTKGMLMRMGAL